MQTLWTAVAERRKAADGSFVYAVRTTGIYCRPSCPSRRPNRDNVEFFALPEAAEQAGYRACQRCRPRDEAASDPALERVRRACRAIERAVEDEAPPPSLGELAGKVGSSPFHLHRLFKRHLGISPRDFAEARRLARVKSVIREEDDVSSAVYAAGYGSPSRLYERSDAQLGMTPASYAKGGKGARIAFTTAASSFGRLLIAATGRGICAVTLGDDDDALERALRAEYPAAEIRRDDDALGAAVGAVLDGLAGATTTRTLPLDLLATAFQWRVWKALQAIPRGETTTYAALAEQLGLKQGARAVARACASNRVAGVIPCHRVVRGDGSLGGYRWGLERKAALLASEKRRG
jgi:AraC family transcriptional regulator, regulatory protein of adaptative response / methylated-DNA-[protein]-cysteine methyltransferase